MYLLFARSFPLIALFLYALRFGSTRGFGFRFLLLLVLVPWFTLGYPLEAESCIDDRMQGTTK